MESAAARKHQEDWLGLARPENVTVCVVCCNSSRQFPAVPGSVAGHDHETSSTHTRFRYQEDVQSVPGCLVSSMDQLSPLDLSTTQLPRRSSVSDGESGTSRSGSPSLSVTPTPSDITTSGAGDHHFTTKRFLYKYQAQQSESLVNNQDLITYGKT